MSRDLLKVLFFLCVLLNGLFDSSLSFADTLETQLPRDKISLGETFNLSFTLNGSAHGVSPDFSPLKKDFRILGTNYGSTINIVNGVATNQTFWQLTLEPKKIGNLIIPEVSFGKFKSTPRTLVVQENNQSLSDDKQDAPVFVKAEISNTSPYIQSQVLYTFKLFYRTQLENSRFELPSNKDTTFIQLGEGSQYQTTINGIPFYVVEKNFAFFPQKDGKLRLPAAHFRALTYDSNALVNNPFYFSSPKSFSLATEAFDLSVRSIPKLFQGATWLPANNMVLTEKWSANTNEWESGTPITRTITLQAYGLRADQLPDLSFDKIPDMNVYVDPAKRSNRVESDTVVGMLEQKVTYIPNLSQAYTIPAVKLNWWNLRTNSDALAQLNSVNVQVKLKAVSPTTSVLNAGLSQPAIKPIIENSVKSNVQISVVRFYQSIWFWITLFLSIIWLITLWLFFKKKSYNHLSPLEKVEPVNTQLKLTDTEFEHACKTGNVNLAQQFLLSWAKKEWQVPILNLETLHNITSDENFKIALGLLQQAIYARKQEPWDGLALFIAYQKIKKEKKHSKLRANPGHFIGDPLPPLHPDKL